MERPAYSNSFFTTMKVVHGLEIIKNGGYFPAVSAAWEIANMPFMANLNDKITSLKLRASYGVTGRRAGSNYQSIQTYSFQKSNYFIDGELGFRFCTK